MGTLHNVVSKIPHRSFSACQKGLVEAVMCHSSVHDRLVSEHNAWQSSSAKEAAWSVFANAFTQLVTDTSCEQSARIDCGLTYLLCILLQLAWTQTTICSLTWPVLSNPQATLKHRQKAIATQYLSRSSRRYLRFPCARDSRTFLSAASSVCLLICARTVRHVDYRNRSKLKEQDGNIESSATRIVAQMRQR